MFHKNGRKYWYDNMDELWKPYAEWNNLFIKKTHVMYNSIYMKSPE